MKPWFFLHKTNKKRIKKLETKNSLQAAVQVSSDKPLKPIGLFGQCGKRNAQGINGRIAAANPFNEGDTDFGKYSIKVDVYLTW